MKRRERTTHRSRGRIAVAVLVALSAVLSLAACSGGNSDDATTPSDKALVLWDYQQQPGTEYLKRLDDWSAKSGVKIDRVVVKYEDFLSKILQAAAANQLPDVIMIDNPWNSAMAEQGVLEDITDRVNEWGQWDTFYPGPAASATWKDRIYGVPNESNALIMYYDKTVLDEAGVQVPTTWDELAAAAAKLTTADRYGFATSMTKSENSVFVFESLLWQAGADLDSLRSPEALSAMEFLKNLQTSGSMSSEALSWDLRGGVTELVNGRAAIAWDGTWDYNWAAENMQDGHELGVALLPSGADSAASNLGGENWAITTTSEMKDQAWDLVTFAVDPAVQMPYLVESGQLPSRSDLAGSAEFSEEPFGTMIKQLELARARVYGPNYPKMADAIVTAFQSVLSGQDEPASALTKAADTIEPLLVK